MLVLSRRKAQRIMIGDDIIVDLLEIRGDQVRLGITAPKNLPVHREEILLAIHREQRCSAQDERSTIGPEGILAAA
jgi:carbon storage regulator